MSWEIISFLEDVGDSHTSIIMRRKIESGWKVVVFITYKDGKYSYNNFEMPDPCHTWKIEDSEQEVE